MKLMAQICMIFILLGSNCHAIEKYTLKPQPGTYIGFFKEGKKFEKKVTNYEYSYELLINETGKHGRIAAVHNEIKGLIAPMFFDLKILKISNDLLILSKDPIKEDPYQEFYFIYPNLKMGFIILGKANDGFEEKRSSSFPDASVSAIPFFLED